jgi:hypothetical protein
MIFLFNASYASKADKRQKWEERRGVKGGVQNEPFCVFAIDQPLSQSCFAGGIASIYSQLNVRASAYRPSASPTCSYPIKSAT